MLLYAPQLHLLMISNIALNPKHFLTLCTTRILLWAAAHAVWLVGLQCLDLLHAFDLHSDDSSLRLSPELPRNIAPDHASLTVDRIPVMLQQSMAEAELDTVEEAVTARERHYVDVAAECGVSAQALKSALDAVTAVSNCQNGKDQAISTVALQLLSPGDASAMYQLGPSQMGGLSLTM